MMRILVTSASGANGDGYGTLLSFSVAGKPAGPFSDDPRIADPRGLSLSPAGDLVYVTSGDDRVLPPDKSCWGIRAWLYPTGPPRVQADGICKARRHPADPGVVGTSSSAHHAVLNEFPGPGQQPTGNPGGRLTSKERLAVMREAEIGARRQQERARPVRVRIVWGARMWSPVPRVLGQAERDWFRLLAGRGPLGAAMARDVQYVDFTLSTGDGFVVDSPALPRIAAGKIEDAVNVLPVSARPDPDPFSPAEEVVPYHNPIFRPMG